MVLSVLCFGTVVSVVVGLLLVNGDDGVAPSVSSCTLPISPVVLFSYAFVSAETLKTTLRCTQRTVHFLVLILLFFWWIWKWWAIFFGSLSWPTRLNSNNPVEMFGIQLYLLYILVSSPKTVMLWPVNKLPLSSSYFLIWRVYDVCKLSWPKMW
jgi:hypothetical protein